MITVQLAPASAGAVFTAKIWTAEAIEYPAHTPRKLRDISIEAGSRAEAFRLFKRRARQLGYRGTFTSYVDAWRHF